MSESQHTRIRKKSEKEPEEQAYRLRMFLEIVAEADMLLLKKIMEKRVKQGAAKDGET